MQRSGKVGRYALPVSGFGEAGPVDPLQLPREFTHITCHIFVSIHLPGLIIPFHHPSAKSVKLLAAYALGERLVRIITLRRVGFGVPRNSKATRPPINEPPRCMWHCNGGSINRVAGVMNSLILVHFPCNDFFIYSVFQRRKPFIV